MTAITCATGVILALIIVICVVIYIGRKRGKIFCNKHVQKGKKIYIYKRDWYFFLSMKF